MAKRLCETRLEAERTRRQLIELKLRVFYHRPSSVSSLSSTTTATTTSTTIDQMLVKIQQAELRYQQARRTFEHEYSQMQENHRNLVKDKGMTTVLLMIIERQLTLITDKLRTMGNFRLDYYLRENFADSDPVTHMGLPVNVINTTTYALTNEQERLLCRGPAYVPVAQMYSRFLRGSTRLAQTTDLVKKLYAPLQHRLASLFYKHHINIALSMEMNKVVYEVFKDCFGIGLPKNVEQRARFEKQLVRSIRQWALERGLILRRTADDQNTFFIGDRQVFDAKIKEYLRQMADTYQVAVARRDDDANDEALKNELNDMIDSINMFLGVMKSRKLLNDEVIKRMEVDRARLRLPYAYFLPLVSKVSGVRMCLFR